MTRILILKTAALGDVLRTTSILPGLRDRHPQLEVTWVTGPDARELVEHHPLVARVETVDPSDRPALSELSRRLRMEPWDRVLSFDDEAAMCEFATAVGRDVVSGAFRGDDGRLEYTDDTAEWFDMGLLARDGKAAADRRKRDNRRSHPRIFADMLGIRFGRPELPIPDELRARAAARLEASGYRKGGTWIGLNTGAGGRWHTKELPLENAIALVARLHAALADSATFALFGGVEERDRNARIAAALRDSGVPFVDTGCDNSLREFAALVSHCDVLVTSDSLGLHVATAMHVPIVAFFAPTSAAEIELYDRGAKVVSTAPDYCSYRPDADNSTLTPERIADAVLAVLATARPATRRR